MVYNNVSFVSDIVWLENMNITLKDAKGFIIFLLTKGYSMSLKEIKCLKSMSIKEINDFIV